MTDPRKDTDVVPAINSHPSRKTGVIRMPDDSFQRIMKFAEFYNINASLTPKLVPPVIDSDALHQIAADLQMLGNDQYGDCEAVRWANDRYLKTAALTDKPNYPTMDQVVEVYKTQNPNFPQDDNGMQTDILLDYLHKTGGPDGVKVVAYATVNEQDLAEVELAINIFGSVWVDIIVLDGNQQQFGEGKPWTDDNSKIDGGHAVLGGGNVLKPVSSVDEFIKIATWAQETSLSESFWSGKTQGYSLVMGVYVVIWPENVGTRQFRQGIDVESLKDVYAAVTNGKVLNIPDPTPVPDPTPTPTPTPDPGAASFPGASARVDQHIHSAAHRAAMTVPDWLNKHFGNYFHI